MQFYNEIFIYFNHWKFCLDFAKISSSENSIQIKELHTVCHKIVKKNVKYFLKHNKYIQHTKLRKKTKLYLFKL